MDVPVRVCGDWLLEKQIGRGSFAVVWKASHRTTRQVVAVKEIATDKLNQKLKESLECEISILKRIDHCNIVRLLDTREEGNRMYLVMEYCSGGDLAAFIKRCKRVSEPVAHHLMRQLAAGLKEMWAHNLVHRDLKPQNLLLSSPGVGAVLKIGDFGFARALQPQGLAETLCGSPLYMAPEILQYHKYDAKADLWSIGAILYELVVGRPPFNAPNHVQLLRNIERAEAKIPAELRLSPACTALLRGLLQRNPVERISFEEFFSHEFLVSPAASPASAPTTSGGSICSREGHTPNVSAASTANDAASKASAPLPFELPDGADSDGEVTSPAARALPLAFQQRGELALGGRGPAGPRAVPPAGGVRGQAPLQARLDALPGPGTPTATAGRAVGRRGSFGSRPPPSPSGGRSSMEDTDIVEDGFVIVNSVQTASSRTGSGGSSGGGSRRSSLAAAWHPLAGGAAPQQQQPVAPPQQQHRPQTPPQQPDPPSPRHPQQAGGPLAKSGMSAEMQALRRDLDGGCRPEAWDLVAQVLEGRAGAHLAAGRLPQALALRLLVLQILHVAIQTAKSAAAAVPAGDTTEGAAPGDAATAADAQVQRLATRQRVVAGRAERVGAALSGTSLGGAMPDAWEVAYEDALDLARTAAVQETLANQAASRHAYLQGASVLLFMLTDAPDMALEPRLRLTAPTRARLARYLGAIAGRYAACAAVLEGGNPSYSIASVGLLQRFA